MTSYINLLVLRSSDIERLRDFYEKLFEVKFEKHTDHGPFHYGALFGSVYLEIYSTTKELAQLDSPGFCVEGLDELIGRLESKYLHKLPANHTFGRMAIIKDPDNRLIFLQEIKK